MKIRIDFVLKNFSNEAPSDIIKIVRWRYLSLVKNDAYFYSSEKCFGWCNTTGYHPGPVAPPCADGAPLNKTILVLLPFLNLLLLEPQSFSNKIFLISGLQRISRIWAATSFCLKKLRFLSRGPTQKQQFAFFAKTSFWCKKEYSLF